MKNILIIYPYKKKAIDQLSAIQLLKNQNYNIHVLILEEIGIMHKECKKIGIKLVYVDYKNLKKKNLIYKIIIFSKIIFDYIKKNKINFVFSHLETSCIIAGITNIFCNFKHFYFKHNTEAYEIDGNFKAIFLEYIACKIPLKIICISKKVYDYLIKKKINKKKLHIISYIYNFNYFKNYKFKKKNYKKINFLIIGRFVKSKRSELSIEFFDKLKFKNIQKKLFILGDGPLKKKLQIKYKNNKLIKFLGYKKNAQDFIKSSDILIHFSKTESFGHVVLESALQEKTIFACNNVGTFNCYIKNKKNGFLVPKKDPVNAALKIFRNNDLRKIINIGNGLNKLVKSKFDINNTLVQYDKILKN